VHYIGVVFFFFSTSMGKLLSSEVWSLMSHFMCAFAEPYFAGNSSLPHSPDISGVERQPSLSNVSGFSDSFFHVLTDLVI
jgi:hypothetical protein